MEQIQCEVNEFERLQKTEMLIKNKALDLDDCSQSMVRAIVATLEEDPPDLDTKLSRLFWHLYIYGVEQEIISDLKEEEDETIWVPEDAQDYPEFDEIKAKPKLAEDANEPQDNYNVVYTAKNYPFTKFPMEPEPAAAEDFDEIGSGLQYSPFLFSSIGLIIPGADVPKPAFESKDDPDQKASSSPSTNNHE